MVVTSNGGTDVADKRVRCRLIMEAGQPGWVHSCKFVLTVLIECHCCRVICWDHRGTAGLSVTYCPGREGLLCRLWTFEPYCTACHHSHISGRLSPLKALREAEPVMTHAEPCDLKAHSELRSSVWWSRVTDVLPEFVSGPVSACLMDDVSFKRF